MNIDRSGKDLEGFWAGFRHERNKRLLSSIKRGAVSGRVLEREVADTDRLDQGSKDGLNFIVMFDVPIFIRRV